MFSLHTNLFYPVFYTHVCISPMFNSKRQGPADFKDNIIAKNTTFSLLLYFLTVLFHTLNGFIVTTLCMEIALLTVALFCFTSMQRERYAELSLSTLHRDRLSSPCVNA